MCVVLTSVQQIATRPSFGKTLAILVPLSATLLAGPLPAAAATVDLVGGATATSASAQSLQITVRDGRVDLRAQDVTLTAVLEALAAEAGYEIEIYGNPTSPSSSWNLSGVPVAKALFRLAGDNSVVLCPVGPRGAQILKVYGDADNNAASQVVVRRAQKNASQASASSSRRNKRDGNTAAQAAGDFGGDERLQELHGVMTEGDEAATRLQALAAIDAIGGEPALHAMTDALGDEDSAVREQAISLLGNRTEEHATMALAQAYFAERHANMRLRAIDSLAKQRTESARVLVAAALDDKSPDVQEAARLLLTNWR